MSPVLIAYTTEEGQTQKICSHIGDRLQANTFDVVVHDIRADASLPSDLAAVIVAGSVHLGSHADDLRAFVRVYHEQLSALPAAFVSVSLQAGSPDPRERDVMRTVAEEFLSETRFSPLFLHIAGGAVHDARLGFVERLVIHRILSRKGVDMDPSGDTEFTDWAALDRFVDHFCATLRGEE